MGKLIQSGNALALGHLKKGKPRAARSVVIFKTASDPNRKPIVSILSKGWKVKYYMYATLSFIPAVRRLQPDSTVMVICVANAFCLIQKALGVRNWGWLLTGM